MSQIINNKGSIGEQLNLDCKGLDELIEEPQEDFGLTKREYFVAQAMKGVLASGKLNSMSNGAGASFTDFVAHWSISIADEVLRQLEETEQENKQ